MLRSPLDPGSEPDSAGSPWDCTGGNAKLIRPCFRLNFGAVLCLCCYWPTMVYEYGRGTFLRQIGTAPIIASATMSSSAAARPYHNIPYSTTRWTLLVCGVGTLLPVDKCCIGIYLEVLASVDVFEHTRAGSD